MKHLPPFCRVVLILLGLMMLSGCGFHLRGRTQPQQLQRQWCLSFPAQYDPLYRMLERELKQLGAHITQTCTPGMRAVHITQATFQSTPMATSANTHIRQYALHYRVQLTLSDTEKPVSLNSFRTFTANETQMLGSDRELRSIENAIRRELVGKIIERMRVQP